REAGLVPAPGAVSMVQICDSTDARSRSRRALCQLRMEMRSAARWPDRRPISTRSTVRPGGDQLGQPIVHFEIIGPDLPKLQSFYSDLFDWKIDANNPYHYGLIDTGGGLNGGVGTGGDANPNANYVTVYIGVPDLQAALDKAESLGGKTILPPMEIPNTV